MINLQKLKRMKQKADKIEAQCPACAAAGADSTGNHLVVFPDGRFACVANPESKEHNALIMKLVGDRSSAPLPQLQIHREIIKESVVLMKIGKLGHLGREKPTSVEPECVQQPVEPSCAELAVERPTSPTSPLGVQESNSSSQEITIAEARRFLSER